MAADLLRLRTPAVQGALRLWLAPPRSPACPLLEVPPPLGCFRCEAAASARARHLHRSLASGEAGDAWAAPLPLPLPPAMADVAREGPRPHRRPRGCNLQDCCRIPRRWTQVGVAARRPRGSAGRRHGPASTLPLSRRRPSRRARRIAARRHVGSGWCCSSSDAAVAAGAGCSRSAPAAAAPGAQRSVTLACTRRKQEVQRRRQEQEAAGVAPGCGAPFLRDSALLKHCRHDSDVWMMPRWISQSNPNLFAPVGVGIDGEGGTKACQEFGSAPTFVPYDGQLARVREVAGIKC
mmetsp:Transcript_103669/g.278547  ORF Transcript_103669/g.278547 Transcript_103669/m.278547 type:complete len:293 (-) Transcript_103669:17-895(-)